jgi:DNA-binding transcriptional ArsR family regulator
MVIYRVLDEVFRSWSHTAVLRALLDTASGCTGNEAARRSGMHPRSALKALTSLEDLGMVRRQRGGRDHLFTLNRSHFLVHVIVERMYSAEQEYSQAIMETLASKLQRSLLNATIFGSVAKRLETPLSDLDLCCIVKTEKQKESVRTLLNANAQNLYQSFGIKVAPLLLTLDEAKKKSKTLLVRDILDHGILVSGKNLKDLLND